MKKLITTLALSAAVASPAFAAEGMWRPGQLPKISELLKTEGLEIQAESLASLTEYPLNAVVQLGRYCTASFVSPKGLLVTNHHCAYGGIQYNSDEKNNLISTGFLAKSLGKELPMPPGTSIFVTEQIDDVTQAMVGGLEQVQGLERYEALQSREKALIAECETDGYRCTVNSFFGGAEYLLIKTLEIRDVRLVHAPSDTVGKYGGDIDNWMWPRHTGDYAYLRAYVGKDGKPADYSKKNVPYQPKSFLKMASEALQAEDFVMVAGYPGRTNRYRRLVEVEHSFGWSYPTMHKHYSDVLNIIDSATKNNPDAAIKYASTVASTNNRVKNYLGQMEGAEKVGLVELRKQSEAELNQWIAADSDRTAKYAAAIGQLDQLLQEENATAARDLYYGRGKSALLSAASKLYRLAKENEKPDAERESGYQKRDMGGFKGGIAQLDRRFDAEVDKALWKYWLGHYSQLPAEQRAPALDAIIGDIDSLYANTKLTDSDTRMAWIGKTPAEFEASNDPFIKLAVALYDYDMQLEKEAKTQSGELQPLRAAYMAALIAKAESEGSVVYPDANSTLRVTYGKVTGAEVKDGLAYTPFTSLRGLQQKETGEWPFNSPQKLLNTIEAADYGDYYEKSIDSVPVNYLTTLDTTGGNSGSATLNSRGELVGLIFDGTFESVNSDWYFDETTTRSIHVDNRYMFWVMEKIDGAINLLKEMGVK